MVNNLNQIEILIESEATAGKHYPQRVLFNNKIYYIIFINLNYEVSAVNQARKKQK